MAVAATAGRAVDVAVHHLGAQSQAEAVVARLRSVLTGLGDVSNTEVGAVVGTHVGPGGYRSSDCSSRLNSRFYFSAQKNL